MNNQGYVRFGVALTAALGLHALFFISLNATDSEVDHEELLQVSILAQNKDFQQENVEKTAKNEQKNLKPGQIKSQPELSRQSVNSRDATKAEQLSYKKEVKKASPAHELVVVPHHIQSAIMAKVSYPRQARRRGWQGQAELHFEVSSKAVHEISLLSSSGFSILDKAAFKALASITTLPLSDGSYRLPVLFKLQ